MLNVRSAQVKNPRRLTHGSRPLWELGGAPFDAGLPAGSRAGERREARAIPRARWFAFLPLGMCKKEVERDVGFDRTSDVSDIFPSGLCKHSMSL